MNTPKRDGPRRVAVLNAKGGSGKTTSSVNLAAALGELGLRVLVVDLDGQASASAWLGTQDGGRGLLDVLTAGAALRDDIRPTSAPNVWLIPASTWLATAERALASEVGAEMVLRGALDRLLHTKPDRASEGAWDVVVIDCPPQLGLLTLNALAAVREVVIPVESRAMALQGLASILTTIARVRERLNPALTISALLACRVDTRTNLSRAVVNTLRTRYQSLVLDTVIRENVSLAEAPSVALPITVYAPRSPGAADYRAAAAEWWAR